MVNLLRYELRKRRTAVIGWGIGMALYIVYVMVLYPSIGDQFGTLLNEMNVDTPLFQMFGNLSGMATFSGFFDLYIMEYVPLILAIYAIVNGTGALAGEEEAGTLELLLSLPLARWQIVLMKALAMMVAVWVIVLITAVVGAVTFLAMEAGIGTTAITAGDVLVALLYSWPLVMVYMTLALFLSAFLPGRRIAAMVVTMVLIVSFFGNNLAALSPTLETLQPLFPFFYYDGMEILGGEIEASALLTLFGAIVVFLLLAVISFQRRNVTVGAWPWQRPRPG